MRTKRTNSNGGDSRQQNSSGIEANRASDLSGLFQPSIKNAGSILNAKLRTRKTFLLLLSLFVLSGAIALQCGKSPEEKLKEQGISHYTCPMHPQIKEYGPGQCPICNMDLVRVFQTTLLSNIVQIDLILSNLLFLLFYAVENHV